jgi:hypothetical protein
VTGKTSSAIATMDVITGVPVIPNLLYDSMTTRYYWFRAGTIFVGRY